MKTKNKKKIKVIVGLSGGVDSAVSAALLKQQGYEVMGATMKLWNKTYRHNLSRGACFGPGEKDDIAAAKKAAKILGIRHKVIDVAEEYEKYVLRYFRKEYLAGRTPNPCVICNQKIKFGYLLQKIIEAGFDFDYFATGHYARVEKNQKSGRYNLFRGKDLKKDQSYFLYRLSQAQLRKILLPLGGFTKEEVRKMAHSFGLDIFANKPESQDFVEGGNYVEVIGPAGTKPGEIVDLKGKIIGIHNGLINFTIGQRKGLNIGGLAEPYYVLQLNACRNQVIVGKKNEAFSQEFKINKTNWIAFKKIEKAQVAAVKIRSGAELVECKIIPGHKGVKIKLKKPAFAVTAGQSAVFYKKDIVLGGGIII